jgi:hypothetical protein
MHGQFIYIAHKSMIIDDPSTVDNANSGSTSLPLFDCCQNQTTAVTLSQQTALSELRRLSFRERCQRSTPMIVNLV